MDHPHTQTVVSRLSHSSLAANVWTISTSLRQIVTPGNLIARVSSVIMMATFGTRPLGAMLGAWLSTRFGIASCLVGVLIGFGAQLAIISLSPPVRLRSIAALSETAAVATA